MASYTSTQSGNWSSTSTWGGSGPPGDGDSVTIASGHTVTLDVDQSSYTTGITGLTINGTLKFKEDIVTCLKMASDTNIVLESTGTLKVGDSQNPIQRPQSGSEYRTQLILQGSGTITWTTGSTATMVGWTPQVERTILASDAQAGSTTITTQDALGVQAGDKIVMGSNSVNGPLSSSVESNLGVFTVTGVSGDGKTLTVSPALGYARSAGDYVAWYSRPIKITSGASPIFNTYGSPLSVLLRGVFFPKSILYRGMISSGLDDPLGGHLTFSTGGSALFGDTTSRSRIKDSTIYNSQLKGTFNVYYENCTFIHQGNTNYGFVWAPQCLGFRNCWFQNAPAILYQGTDLYGGVAFFDSCQYKNLQYSPFHFACEFEAANMNFTGTPTSRLYYNYRLYNCQVPTVSIDYGGSPPGVAMESYDHNGVVGAYRAWMRGGTVQSVSDVKAPGKDRSYQYTLNSTSYPVHRMMRLGRIHPGERVEVKVYLRRADNYSSVRAYLFNPDKDPLDAIWGDDKILALAAYPDSSTGVWKTLKLSYYNGSGVVHPIAARIEAKSTGGSGRIIYEYMELFRYKRKITI